MGASANCVSLEKKSPTNLHLWICELMLCRTTENKVEVGAVLDHNLVSYTLSDYHRSDFHLAFVIISKSMYSIHVKAKTRNQAGNSSLGFCDDVSFNNINHDSICGVGKVQTGNVVRWLFCSEDATEQL